MQGSLDRENLDERQAGTSFRNALKTAQRSSSQRPPTMDSETTTTERSASAETSAATVSVTPRIPQEIIDEILDLLSAGGKQDSGPSLRSCCLVAKSWVASCRRHLFHTVSFTWRNATDWIETFPIPQEGPAHFVRELRFWSPGRRFDAPEEFFDHIPWFPGVRSISWKGEAGLQPFLRILSLGRLPQSVTSLSIEMSTVSVLQIRDAMALLPNLNDLKLAGSLVMIDRTRLRGIGGALRGDFCGKLTLLKEHVHPDIVDMLLGVPTGLHFTELHIHGTKQNLHLVVRLSEACGKNLTKLTYLADDHGKSDPALFLERGASHSYFLLT